MTLSIWFDLEPIFAAENFEPGQAALSINDIVEVVYEYQGNLHCSSFSYSAIVERQSGWSLSGIHSN